MISLFPSDDLMLAFWSPGPAEMMVLAVVALLLYGGNLPEVARSWGKSFAEFRRSISGIQSEINDVIYSEPEQIEYRDDSRYANGYEEPDASQEDDDPEDDDQEDGESQLDDSVESEQTVKDAGAETIAVDEPEEKPTD